MFLTRILDRRITARDPGGTAAAGSRGRHNEQAFLLTDLPRARRPAGHLV